VRDASKEREGLRADRGGTGGPLVGLPRGSFFLGGALGGKAS